MRWRASSLLPARAENHDLSSTNTMNRAIKTLLLLECAVLLFPLFYLIFSLAGLVVEVFFRSDGSYDLFGPTLALWSLVLLALLYPVCRGILALLIKILRPETEVLSANSIRNRIVAGIVLATLVFMSQWTQTVMDFVDVTWNLMPVLCVVHLVWLGRNYLFREVDGEKSAG